MGFDVVVGVRSEEPLRPDSDAHDSNKWPCFHVTVMSVVRYVWRHVQPLFRGTPSHCGLEACPAPVIWRYTQPLCSEARPATLIWRHAHPLCSEARPATVVSRHVQPL